jgi:predicted metal-dependent HD superfamily phosphohydrolase
MDSDKRYLYFCWLNTLKKGVGFNRDLDRKMFEEIYRKYWEPPRHYHTSEHLHYCFSMLDYMVPNLPDSGQLEFALWYHDFVYDPHSDDNEERSAEVAVDRLTHGLGLSMPYALQVGQLILATKHTEEPQTREAQILLDVDLAILGAPREAFDLYEHRISREYAWVPEAAYRARRAAILQSFLDRPRIYSTPEFKDSAYGIRAPVNLRHALAQLKAA